MGFLDKAKAAANELATKADTALSGAGLGGPGTGGDADAHLRDLGVLTYLEATSRPADDGERRRVIAALERMEQQGALRSLTLRTTAAPPAPGAGSVPPPPGPGHTPPQGSGPVPPPRPPRPPARALHPEHAHATDRAAATPPSWAGGGGA
ncbi:hypothetical protein [Actinotalea sp. Marseille-Q4924]|uniref:hypothetical protein n=1 Tax=Actinotalea sp. Marseille-Q4924 TaxID=2866571 RepID=UPI001CE49BE5|nr:hypothetical protein [Actinotalea sp. Marseille-Q4924]